MARWQRKVRVGLALFVVLFAVALWFTVRERVAPAPRPVIERLDPTAASEIRGGDVVQHKGAKRDVRVEFGSQIAYTDGRTRFTTFKAFIDDRGGRSFVVSGNEAWLGAGLSTYDVRGDVALSTSDGLTATTPAATFTEAEGVLRGDGPIRFQRGRVSGSGVGFTYDRAVDRMWLADRAVIQVAPEANGTGGMQVAAGEASYSRGERYMRFERSVRLLRDGQVIEADTSTIFLLSDRDEPETVELRGGSKVTGAGAVSALQAMEARDINLSYAADGRTLEQALLMGQSRATLGSASGRTAQQMQADLIDASLASDGSITRLTARDAVRVTLPASEGGPSRMIAAPLLTASGAAGRGLTRMVFENGVEYREDGTAGGAARTARARTMQAALSPGDTIESAEFQGGFRFEEGRLGASSQDARYDIAHGTLALSGRTGSGVQPHVADERLVLDADTIDVVLAPRKVTASGTVRGQFSAGRRPGERGNSLLTDKEPIVVASDTFVFDEAAGNGVYEGKVVLLQQATDTMIRADSMTVNDKDGTLSATGNVVTNLPVAGVSTSSGKRSSIARAGEFSFDDVKRRAVFTKQAQFDGVQGNVRANRIELFLAAGDNSLERLEAHEAVEILVDTRKATGQRLTYSPNDEASADEKYVLTGSPVRLAQECQETTGRTLTFYKTATKIQVDGNQEVRVQAKGGKCP
jgi:lipopolysaccharide export system protein LptA